MTKYYITVTNKFGTRSIIVSGFKYKSEAKRYILRLKKKKKALNKLGYSNPRVLKKR